MALQLEVVSANGPPALLAMAKALVGEYAAMPHIAGRWATPEADISALPAPYVLPAGILLVAHEDAEPIGCGALLAFAPGIGEIKRVYVRPQGRGRGVVEAVTRALIDCAGQLGFDRVRLDTAPELLAARALYERLGFVAIPHYRDGLLPGTLCFERSVRGVQDGGAGAA